MAKPTNRQDRAEVPPEIPEMFRNRLQSLAEVAIDELLAHPGNWRRHPPMQRRALQAALNVLGWLAPVLVNRRSGRMIDGHLRVEVARANGAQTVPVAWLDLDEEEERRALASFDTIGDLGIWDDAALDALIEGFAEDDPMAELFGDVDAGRAGRSSRGEGSGERGRPDDPVVRIVVALPDLGLLGEALELAGGTKPAAIERILRHFVATWSPA